MVRFFNIILIAISGCLLFESPCSAQIRSYPIFEVQTVGQTAMNIGKNKAVIFDMQAVLLDASKKTFPPDSTIFDRSLMAQVRTGYSHPINNRVSGRFVLDLFGTLRREHTETEPRDIISEEGMVYRPALDMTFTTNSGIEVSLGASFTHSPEYFSYRDSATLSVETRYAEYNLMQTRISLMKRGGFGTGGFYFKSGVQTNRDVEINTVNTDNSDNSSRKSVEEIRQPTTLGIVMKIGSSNTQWTGEFQAIQAGEGGEKKEDTGKTVQEDYNTLRLGFIKNLGNMNLIVSLAHRTLSYATSNDVRLDLIPLSTFESGVKAGNDSQFLYAKLILGYGRDLQSTDEFNQEITAKSFGFSAGFKLSL